MQTKIIFSFLLFTSFLLLMGCEKTEGISQAEFDQEIIDNYLAANNLTATEHESGLYYIIETPGSSDHPTVEDTVTVRYKGYFTNQVVFDKTQNDQTINFPLRNLIPAWQIGIPLLGRGGSGTFIVPSRLGYGSQGSGRVPPNTVLIFEIDLVDFK